MPKFLDTRGNPTLAIGICDRCKRKFPLHKLKPDRNSPGLLVCDADNDEFDPWRKPFNPKDANISVRRPRPDEAVTVGSVAFNAVTYALAENVFSTSMLHSCGGETRGLILSVFVDAQAPVFVTYGGKPMVRCAGVFDENSGFAMSMYKLSNPPSGSNILSVVSPDEIMNTVQLAAMSFIGVSQSTDDMTGSPASVYSLTAMSVSLGVESQVGGMVIDMVWNDVEASPVVIGQGQTERWQSTDGLPRGSTKIGATGTVTMSWSDSVDRNWSMLAIPVNPG